MSVCSERNPSLDTGTSILRRPWAPLAVVLAIAVETRFLGLGDHSLWFDEAFSVSVAKDSLPALLAFLRGLNDTHPPLYYALLGLWVRLLGQSEFAVRGLSALCGVLTVVLLYAFARRVVDRTVALVAATVLAGSAFAVHASQEARMYALLGLLALASWTALVRAMEARKTWAWVLYSLSTLLMLYTHYFGFLVLGSQVLYLIPGFWRERRVPGPAAVAWLAVAVLFAPWMPVLIGQLTSGSANPTFRPPVGIPALVTLLGLFGFGGELFGAGGYFHIPILPWWKALLVSAPFLALLAAGVFALRGRRAWLLLCYWVAPIAAVVLVSPRFNVFYPRYFSFLTPAFALLLAAGLDLTARSLARTARVRDLGHAAVLGGLIILVLAVNAPVLNGYVRESVVEYDWRGAAELVSAAAGPSDFLLFVPGFAQTPFEYYYKGSMGRLRLTPVEIYQMVRKTGRATPGLNKEWARRLAEAHPHLWIVATVPMPGSAYIRLRRLLEDSFAPGQSWDFHSVYVYELTSRVNHPNARKL